MKKKIILNKEAIEALLKHLEQEQKNFWDNHQKKL